MERTIFTTPTEGHRSWRLPVDDPTAETGDERSTEMNTQNMQAEPSSPHLTAARQLLEDISAESDAQAKATAAAAHATLVLAEQVALARITMARTALVKHQQPEVSS